MPEIKKIKRFTNAFVLCNTQKSYLINVFGNKTQLEFELKFQDLKTTQCESYG